MARRSPNDVCGAPSASTALRQVPALHRRVPWRRGGVNLDVGGGPYGLATAHLGRLGVENIVVDPGWQTPRELARAMGRVAGGQASTVTIANTLNVIRDADDRSRALQLAANAVAPDGVVYVSVHEGNRSGRGRETTRGWQSNRTLRSYVREVRRWFHDVRVTGGAIEARRPKPSAPPTIACSTSPNGRWDAFPNDRAPVAADLHARLLAALPEAALRGASVESSGVGGSAARTTIRPSPNAGRWLLNVDGFHLSLLGGGPSLAAVDLRTAGPEQAARAVAAAIRAA